MPGICFSMNGARLGRGSGYYDRLCDNYTGERLGVCYELQKRTEVPVDAWDKNGSSMHRNRLFTMSIKHHTNVSKLR